jgi:hypothetical protein
MPCLGLIQQLYNVDGNFYIAKRQAGSFVAGITYGDIEPFEAGNGSAVSLSFMTEVGDSVSLMDIWSFTQAASRIGDVLQIDREDSSAVYGSFLFLHPSCSRRVSRL